MLQADSSWTPTVLLVDDSPTVRLLLRRRLMDNQLRVLEASDGVHALDLLLDLPDDQLPDFVVSDTQMPRMTGEQLREVLRANPRTADLPTFLYTSSRPEQLRELPQLLAGHLSRVRTRRRLRQARTQLGLPQVRPSNG